MRRDLFGIIKQASKLTDSIILFFSSGKDSIVTLDLCSKYFKSINPVFMYKVQGISYREKILKYYETRYKVKIVQIPDYDLMNYQIIQSNSKKGKIKIGDIENYLRRKLNISYIVYGQKNTDGFMTKLKIHTGIDQKFKRFYPVAIWTDNEIFEYIKKNKLPLSPEYQVGFKNIDTFKGEPLLYIYNNYPDDYQKIKKQFPHIEADLLRAREKYEGIEF